MTPGTKGFRSHRWPQSETVELGESRSVGERGTHKQLLGYRLNSEQAVKFHQLGRGEFVLTHVEGKPSRIYHDRVVIAGDAFSIAHGPDDGVTAGGQLQLASPRRIVNVGPEIVVVTGRLGPAGKFAFSTLLQEVEIAESERHRAPQLDRLVTVSNDGVHQAVGVFTSFRGQTVPVRPGTESILWAKGRGRLRVDVEGVVQGIDSPFWPGRGPKLATDSITIGQPARIALESGGRSDTPVIEAIALNVIRVEAEMAQRLTDGATAPLHFIAPAHSISL